MPHWLISVAAIGGRALAALLASLCFYMAFFLYEDQEGQWQNRIDDMWLSIYDSANRIDNLSTAIFNRIGQFFTRAADRIFGHRALSMRMVSASVNLSAGGYLLSIAYTALHDGLTGVQSRDDITACLSFLGIGAFFLLLAYLPMQFKHPVVPYLCAAPIFSLIGLCFFTLIKEKYFDVISDEVRLREVRHVEGGISAVLLLLIFSLLSDIAVVVLVRKVMKYIGKNLSLTRILLSIASLLALFSLIIPAPYFVTEIPAVASADGTSALIRIAFFAHAFLTPLNLVTGLYCLVPIIALLILFLHRLMWPTLSKLVYPLCRHKIVTNKKVLVAVGSLAVTVALDIEHVGAKELLKLFAG